MGEQLKHTILLRQYLSALLILSFVLAVLAFFPISRLALDVPDRTGNLANPWNGSDVHTYVAPARTFLQTGEFLRHGKPDLHRTIGYPFFLSVMMLIFGQYWVFATHLVQLVIVAMLFPAVTYISFYCFRFKKSNINLQFWLLIASGVGLSYVGQLLTDQLFTSLLTVGVAFAIGAVIRRSWLLALLHIVVLAWAAQIRPTLALFWIADFCFMVYAVKSWNGSYSTQLKWMLSIIVVTVAIVGNGPSIRNYVNHGLFTPTDILSNNLAHYLAGPVLISEKKGQEYSEISKQLNALDDKERIVAQKKFAKEVIEQYPFATVKRLTYHLFWNLYEPHWEYIAFVFGKGFYLNNMLDDHGQLRWQLLLAIPFFILYSLLYVLAFVTLVQLIRKKEWFLLLGIATYLLPLAASMINGQGARMRLCVEPLLVILACGSVSDVVSWIGFNIFNDRKQLR